MEEKRSARSKHAIEALLCCVLCEEEFVLCCSRSGDLTFERVFRLA